MKRSFPVMPLIAVFGMALVLLAATLGLNGLATENARAEHLRIMKTLLPGSESFTVEPYSGENDAIRSVHKGETGFVIETEVVGYADDITMLIGVSSEGTVTGLTVREMHETLGLGANALTDWQFLAQFLQSGGDAAVGENVDALTGATVTSKAIARSVNAAVGYVTGTDADTSATAWGN